MKNLRMLFCMLMGLLIGSVLGIVIANLTHNQQKKKHAQMAATEVTATADALSLCRTYISAADTGRRPFWQREKSR